MAAVQRNFNYFAYVSDDGTTYCMKADQDWGSSGASGGAACTGDPAWGRSTTRRMPRKAIFVDPTTFRTVTAPVFTTTAYAALTVGTSTLSVSVPGETAAVTYTLKKKTAERIPSTVIGRQDPDHA